MLVYFQSNLETWLNEMEKKKSFWKTSLVYSVIKLIELCLIYCATFFTIFRFDQNIFLRYLRPNSLVERNVFPKYSVIFGQEELWFVMQNFSISGLHLGRLRKLLTAVVSSKSKETFTQKMSLYYDIILTL